MSAELAVILTCDGVRFAACELRYTAHGTTSVVDARQRARKEQGWRSGMKQGRQVDMCPLCQPKKKGTQS